MLNCYCEKVGFTVALVALALTTTVRSADAQVELKRLGAFPPSAIHVPALTTPASLHKVIIRPRVNQAIRRGLELGGLSSIADRVLDTLTNPKQVVRGTWCDKATPEDGFLVECDVAPGKTLEWMAYRERVGKGNARTVALLQNVVWVGRKPFKAFLLQVKTEETTPDGGRVIRTYRFVLPKPCSNLSLMDQKKDTIPPPPQPRLRAEVGRSCTCDKLTTTVRVFPATGGSLEKLQRVGVMVDGAEVGALVAPGWSMTTDRAGTYTFQAIGSDQTKYTVEPASIAIEPCPPLPLVAPKCNVKLTHEEVKGGYQFTIDATGSTAGSSTVPAKVVVQLAGPTGAIGEPITLDSSLTTKVIVPRRRAAGTYAVTSTVTSPGTVVDCKKYDGSESCKADDSIPEPPRVHFFVDGLFGKERRIRPAGDPPAGATEFGQCSPLLGAKFGVGKSFRNDWELAAAVGLGISLVTADDKVHESPLFIDVEGNKYFGNRTFLGTGVSFWDLTRSATFTPAWLVHFGVPLTDGNGKYPVYFITEGRLFFDHIDDIANNYQLWGGIRIRFPKK